MTKTKLSATQQLLIKVAAGCDDRAIRWPANLRGGARAKIIAALVAAGFAGTWVALQGERIPGESDDDTVMRVPAFPRVRVPADPAIHRGDFRQS